VCVESCSLGRKLVSGQTNGPPEPPGSAHLEEARGGRYARQYVLHLQPSRGPLVWSGGVKEGEWVGGWVCLGVGGGRMGQGKGLSARGVTGVPRRGVVAGVRARAKAGAQGRGLRAEGAGGGSGLGLRAWG
jgi:hypothetical protein